MKIKELREKNTEELKRILTEKQENVRKFRFDIATRQAKNNRDIRKNKKDIAKVLTIINENNGK